MTQPALWVAAASSLLLVVVSQRVLRLVVLAIQYGAVALLSSMAIPGSVAAVKLVGGLIACGILGLTSSALRADEEPQERPARGRFRAVAAVLVLVAALGIGQTNWMEIPEISPAANSGATLLIAMGLLLIGLARTPIGVCVGLMTLLSGFEVSYSVIEPSLAVLALLASVHIGLALVVSYLNLLTGPLAAEP